MPYPEFSPEVIEKAELFIKDWEKDRQEWENYKHRQDEVFKQHPLWKWAQSLSPEKKAGYWNIKWEDPVAVVTHFMGLAYK